MVAARLHARAVAVLAAALMVSALPPRAAPQPQPKLLDLAARAAAARAKGDVAGWLQWGRLTLARAPDHPDLLISVARAEAAAGHDTEALRRLDEAARRGAGFDPAVWPELARLKALAAMQPIAARARTNLQPIARAALLATLPSNGSEGVAYDPLFHRVLVGTDDGRILQVALDGQVSEFVRGGGLRQVLGVKVDSRRGLLWVVSGRYPDQRTIAQAPADLGLSGLRAFHLDTGAPAAAYDLDERPAILHGFNDIALAEDGDVYVTDSPTDAVYRLRDGKLSRLASGPDLTAANGIALAPDQRRLFVATALGVSLIDLRTGRRARLQVPADGAVNSIDGLLWWRDGLVGVQSSPYLARIIRMELDARSRRITKVTVLNARSPAEYSQTTIAADGGVFYVAAGQPAPSPDGRTPTVTPSPRVLVVRPP